MPYICSYLNTHYMQSTVIDTTYQILFHLPNGKGRYVPSFHTSEDYLSVVGAMKEQEIVFWGSVAGTCDLGEINEDCMRKWWFHWNTSRNWLCWKGKRKRTFHVSMQSAKEMAIGGLQGGECGYCRRKEEKPDRKWRWAKSLWAH